MLKNDSSSTSNPKSPFGGNSPPSTISPSSINEPSYLETLINNSNPVETLILGIHLLQFISIILILNLIISLFLKYLSTKNFEFKWVDYIFPGTSKYNKIFKIKLRGTLYDFLSISLIYGICGSLPRQSDVMPSLFLNL